MKPEPRFDRRGPPPVLTLPDVCGRGFLASQWAKTNGMEPDAGIALLRSALSTLARFYGFQEAEREHAA